MTIDLMNDLQGMEAATLDSLRAAETSGEGVRLPFPALYAYWINGNAQLKPLGNVQYFGGWATDADRAIELVDSGAMPDLPSQWTAFEGSSGDKTYRALGNRLVRFCPIAYRTSWVGPDGSRRQKFNADTGHTKSHMQYLGQIQNTDGHIFPCVLTTKGYQASFLSEALGRWRSALAPFLKQMNATRFPLSAFWLTLGTHGPKPEFKEVGSTETKPVTPVKAVIPEGLTVEAVHALFAGREVLMLNGELLEQARDWLNAWKDEAQPARAAQPPVEFDEFGQQP